MSHPTEADMLRALTDHFAKQGYVVARQVDAPAVEQGGRMVSRRIDLVAVHPGAPGLRQARTVAVETKVTRQDFASDVRNPEKQAPWVAAAGAHYFATPAGLVEAVDVPAPSGLLTVEFVTHPTGKTYTQVRTVKAPDADLQRPTPAWLTTELLLRGTAASSRLAGWAADPTPLEDLHARLDAAAAENERLASALERANERAEAWRALAASQGRKVPCSACGAPVVPTRVSAGALAMWRHAQPHLTGGCPANLTGVRPVDLQEST